MLYNEDLKLNLIIFRIASALGFIPVDFDSSSWRMSPTGKTWKMWLFRMWMGLFSLHFIWLCVRAGGSLKGANWDFVPVNLIVAAGFVVH
jgi:hypothetical protein